MNSVHQDDRVSEAWRAHRPYLVDLAFRMLGDMGAAEDVVQEAFSRLVQARQEEIADARGWLIVVTSRLCLDQIKSARSRRERAEDVGVITQREGGARSVDPADRITLDDNVRLALLVVLERLRPAERVVFVLHDIFQLPFDVVAETVGRTSSSCRQLARRARLKIEASNGAASLQTNTGKYQDVSEKFIAACASGELDELTGSQSVARNIIHFWGRPEVTLVSQPLVTQLAILAFVERELAGILLLDTNDAAMITEIHVLAEPSKLGVVRTQLSLIDSTH